MVSLDIKAGYRHFRLAPKMRYWFIFAYDGSCYKCIALPFGWGRSPMWFTHLMVPLVTRLRQLYRALACRTTFSSVLPRGGEQQA
jgi:hypothetical protein